MTGARRWAARIVAAWLPSGSPLRDVVAAETALRAEPQRLRAEAARTALAVIARLRRLRFVLWRETPPVGLPMDAQATALVLAHAVATGALDAAGAAREYAAATARSLDFAALPANTATIDAIADPVRRFAVRHSMPDWAAARVLARFAADAEPLAEALAAPPPRTLRANTLRCTRDQLATLLAAEGVQVHPAPRAPHGVIVDGDADLFATACWRDGRFEHQDEASQLAALVVAPPPRGRVLDLCAGSGGKTLALAAALDNRGEILATDVHAGRLRQLRERARRAGAANVRAVVIAADGPTPAIRAFGARADRILVDAPCSGIGSWRRRPEARWTVLEADVAKLVEEQQRLLAFAAELLRPGARVVYATCSLLAEENEAVVTRLLARRPEFESVRIAEILGDAAARPIADATGTFLSLRPDRHGTDGFFAAVIRRRAAK